MLLLTLSSMLDLVVQKLHLGVLIGFDVGEVCNTGEEEKKVKPPCSQIICVHSFHGLGVLNLVT
jgi:hypothetical protein